MKAMKATLLLSNEEILNNIEDVISKIQKVISEQDDDKKTNE